jgi:hypothetical protein
LEGQARIGTVATNAPGDAPVSWLEGLVDVRTVIGHFEGRGGKRASLDYARYMSLPPCQSDDDCSMMIGTGAVCVFDPGCSPGQGRCVSTPLTVCSTYTGDIAHYYCGCDGQTFNVGVPGSKNFPDRPYAHLGACP